MPQPSRDQFITDHRLDRLDLTLAWPQAGVTELQAVGRSSSRRRALWTYTEGFGPANSDLAPHDAAAHLLLICQQDRPRTRALLDFALRGGSLWEDQELPWT